MGIQFKRSVLEMLILSLINNNKYTSFQIEHKISSEIKIPEGSIYPILSYLIREKYIETNFELNEHGKNKKYYQLTPKGISYLNQLKTEWHDLTKRINLIVKEE